MKTKFELGEEIVVFGGGIRKIHRIEIFRNSHGFTVNYHDIDGYNIGSDQNIDRDYVKRIEAHLNRASDALNKMKNKLGIEE